MAVAGTRNLQAAEIAEWLCEVRYKRALKGGGQKTGAVLACPFDDRTRADGDKARQVLIFGTQSVSHPRANAGPSEDALAGVH